MDRIVRAMLRAAFALGVFVGLLIPSLAFAQTYTSPGSYNWYSSNATQVTLYIVGAGGGSGGGAFTGDYGGSGGGGSGGYYWGYSFSVTPGTNYTVNVGQGGAGGSGGCWIGACPGGSGGASYFSGNTGTVEAYGGGGSTNGGANQCSGGGSAGSPNGSAGQCTWWYQCPATSGAGNGTGYGSGANYPGGCLANGLKGGDGYVAVAVTATSPSPTLTLNASPNPTVWNSGTTLSWSVANGVTQDACYIGGGQYGSGVSVGKSGSATTNAITGTTQYSFWCHDTYYGWVGPVYRTVTVTPPPTPTATITANSKTPLTVRTGTTVNLNAAFTTGATDAGQASDIEGDAANPGGETGARTATAYASGKTYSFTPSVAGTYTFYARAQTTYYSTLTTYATVTVNVVAPPAVPNGNEILGWGWSDQAGWVSLNWFTDPVSPYAYGLTVDSSGDVTGYAWSDSLGWLSANAADVSACGPAPTLSQSTHRLLGWLRAINSNSSSWDGCVSLSSANKGDTFGYVVTISDSNSANSNFGSFTNAAWSPNVPQWIVFDGYCQTTPVSCINSTQYSYYQYCFAQTNTCSAGTVCQNGTGCVTASPPTGCLQIGGITSCAPVQKTSHVLKGNSTKLYWNVSGVNVSCSITGSDGESWPNITSGAASGSATITTAAINGQTTFTLSCDSGSFTDQVTANLSPVYREQ